jgi:hypothetical protein
MAIGQLTQSFHLTRLSFFFQPAPARPTTPGEISPPASAAAPRHPCLLMSQLVLPHKYVVRTRIHTPQLSSHLTNTTALEVSPFDLQAACFAPCTKLITVSYKLSSPKRR